MEQKRCVDAGCDAAVGEIELTQGVSVTSIDRLGIGLVPNDVAKVVVKLIDAPNGSTFGTHFPVGWLTHILYYLSQVLPAPLMRVINRMVVQKY